MIPLWAEIAPQYYREMQQKAPEQLKIRTISVSRDWYFWRSERTVKVTAEVIEVKRSAVNIVKGNRIFFEYAVFTPPANGWAGPRPMPLLDEGYTCDFFGERLAVQKDRGIVLSPTARGYSFESLLD